MANNNLDLLSYAKRARAGGWSSIPVKTDKQPNVPQVIPFRDTLLTDSELDELFGANIKQTTAHVAVIVDSDKFAIDMDGEGENVFTERILPRLNQELIHKVNRTTNTKSPHGRHLLGRTKGGNKQLTKKEHIWQSPSKNNEIRLRLYGFYSIEYGQGYEEIIGIENSQVFEPEEISEIIQVANEVNAIRSITELVRLYYVNGNRDEINFSLSGFLHKGHVPEQLIFDIVEPLIDYSNPVEPKKTHDVIHSTCQKDRSSSEVSGYHRFLTAFGGNHEKVQEIERILSDASDGKYFPRTTTNKQEPDTNNDIGQDEPKTPPFKVLSVSEAKHREACKNVMVVGMISSYSTSYKVVTKSEWQCNESECGTKGSESYNPPLLTPKKNLDNTGGFKINCFNCDSTKFWARHEYANARLIQLENVSNEATADENSTIDRLDVVLYDNACLNVIAGTMVDITGDLYIQKKSDTGNDTRSRKLVNVFHAEQIRYRNKEKIIITPKDIEIFYKHKKICEAVYQKEQEAAVRLNDGALTRHKVVPLTYVDRLVAMFAPNVIGNNNAKLGLLRTIVGGNTTHGDDNGRRGRINTFLIGDPGTAKSILARESTKLLPNSRYVNAQNASATSFVGMVDKQNDSYLLRLGLAPLARNAICAVNEIGLMSLEDQGHLTDIAEEGKTTLSKYSLHFELDAPTSIVATANPLQTKWDSSYSISKDEMPILKTMIDRADQVYGSRDSSSEQEVREYTRQKTRLRRRKAHNYNFLRKLLIYAKSINPVIVKFEDSDPENRLNEFWIDARLKDAAANRTYDSIFRLVEAQARLNLTDQIGDDIATQIMDSMRLMLAQYGKIVETVQNPRDIAYNAFLNILKQTKAPVSIEQLHKIACQENKQIQQYLGDQAKIRDNKKLRKIIDMLLNHSCIRQIQQNPVVLQFLSDLYDPCDPTRQQTNFEK